MKTLLLPSKLLEIYEYDMIGEGVTLKLKHQVAEWMMDNEVEYTVVMPNVRGPLGVMPKVVINDDRKAMLFKLTWF